MAGRARPVTFVMDHEQYLDRSESLKPLGQRRQAMLKLHLLDGAVAQLGERRVRNAKVEGSIPFRSTI